MISRMPYRRSSRVLYIIWASRMQKSKVHRLADTGIRKNFFRISGGMSMPPVEAPPRMTIPRDRPMPIPAKSTFSRALSVTCTLPRRRSRTSRAMG